METLREPRLRPGLARIRLSRPGREGLLLLLPYFFTIYFGSCRLRQSGCGFAAGPAKVAAERRA